MIMTVLMAIATGLTIITLAAISVLLKKMGFIKSRSKAKSYTTNTENPIKEPCAECGIVNGHLATCSLSAKPTSKPASIEIKKPDRKKRVAHCNKCGQTGHYTSTCKEAKK